MDPIYKYIFMSKSLKKYSANVLHIEKITHLSVVTFLHSILLFHIMNSPRLLDSTSTSTFLLPMFCIIVTTDEILENLIRIQEIIFSPC